MTTKGFTLIELMVTISIMLIMTSVVIFNYNKFNDSSLLGAFAYDISLTIRQAQVYGVAVKEGGASGQMSPISTDSFNNFQSAYGVHFDKSTPEATPLTLFVDENNNGSYDNGETVIQTYKFQRGINIESLCIANNVSLGNNPCTFDALDIVFKRPDPEAKISGTGINIRGHRFSNGSEATIKLQNSSNDLHKSVVVEQSGQISVQ